VAIREYSIAVTTTGAAGSATGDEDSSDVIEGELLDVYLGYHASAPGATTDVTLKVKGDSDNILVVSNNATDGRYTPRQKPVDAANAAITNAHDRWFIPVKKLNLAVAQCDALTAAVTATVKVRTP